MNSRKRGVYAHLCKKVYKLLEEKDSLTVVEHKKGLVIEAIRKE